MSSNLSRDDRPDLMRISDLENELNINRRTIYRMIQRGEFPAPRRVGPRMSYWLRDVVTGWQSNLPEAPSNTN